MAEMKDIEMLTALQDTLNDAESKQLTHSNEDAAAYPKEKADSFDTAGMTFTEITTAILDQTEDLFYVTRVCNRFSPDYLKYCKRLVKAVGHLGSAYITQTAVCLSDLRKEEIRNLTPERLNRMISFNFRKCNAALKEINQKNQSFDLEYFDMLLLLDTAMQRLRATRAHAKSISYEDVRKHSRIGTQFLKEDENKKTKSDKTEDEPFRSAPSYEIRYDVVENADFGSGENPKTETPMLPAPDEENEPDVENLNIQGSATSLQPCTEENEEAAVRDAEQSEGDDDAEETEQERKFREGFEQLTPEEQTTLVNAMNNPMLIENMRNWMDDPNGERFFPERVESCRKILALLSG